MNTQLKFRVWDVKNKRFLSQSHFAILGNGKLIVTNSGYYTHFDNTNDGDYIVHRYTGIKDVNNDKIYEGDILIINLYKDKPDGKKVTGTVVFDVDGSFWMLDFNRKEFYSFYESDPTIVGINLTDTVCGCRF